MRRFLFPVLLGSLALTPWALSPVEPVVEPVEIEVGPVAVMTPPARALSPIDPSVVVLTVSRLAAFRVTSVSGRPPGYAGVAVAV